MQLANYNWPSIEALSRDMPVVFPIASLEQHGEHLPVFTDSMLLAEVSRRAAEQTRMKILWAPLLWIGNSEHHADFPGTISASPRVYLDLLQNVAESFIQHGFKRLVFLNGHGGNETPAKQALFELRQKYRKRNDLLLLLASYWGLGGEPWKTEPSLLQREMGHACEWETSMIMCLNKRMIAETARLRTVEFGNAFSPAFRPWITRERTQNGHIGSPQFATVEKGEALFSTFAKDVVTFLERVLRWDGKSWEG